MLNYPENHPRAPFDSQEYLYFAIKWTPRAIVAGLAAYYSLGIAYERGYMAAIDRVAIRTLRHWMGYAGIGAFMPTFQWYSAWSVRMVAALSAGVLYDMIEKVVRAVFARFSLSIPSEEILIPAPLYRSPFSHPPIPHLNSDKHSPKPKKLNLN